MKSKYFFISMIYAIPVFLVQCFDRTGINNQDAGNIKYNYFKDSGCINHSGLAKITDVPVIKWNYFEGNLDIELQFTTNCVAKLKDSVIVSNGSIDVFLKDTSSVGALCVCPFKEEFNFYIPTPGRIEVNFNFGHYNVNKYSLIADTVIYLN